ncbi:MAG: site-specific integrase [Solirubrobacterales bacterium]|nr:site-specific integrase [Solirubrobacterales bacterium]
MSTLREPSGHVFRVDRARGPVWYAKYRLPDGRQVQKKIGPAWADRGRPREGYFTKRTAEVWLQDVLAQARRGTLPGARSASVTFAEAAEEWMRFIEQDRGRKPSTLKDYRNVLRSRLLPAFGERPIEAIERADIEHWRASLDGLSNRSKNKLLIQLHGIFRRAQSVYGLEKNPLATVEKHPLRPSGDIEVFSPEEVWALVRAAASEQDAAIFLTAAFTGLRLGELLALRWRDVDWSAGRLRVRQNYVRGEYGTPKTRRGSRGVPLADRLAGELDQLHRASAYQADDALVFGNPHTGTPLDGAALLRAFQRALKDAGVRKVRFHDLRHTFGTRMAAAGVPMRALQEFMGHRDLRTTLIYADYAPGAREVELVNEAFAPAEDGYQTGTKLRPTRTNSDQTYPENTGEID